MYRTCPILNKINVYSTYYLKQFLVKYSTYWGNKTNKTTSTQCSRYSSRKTQNCLRCVRDVLTSKVIRTHEIMQALKCHASPRVYSRQDSSKPFHKSLFRFAWKFCKIRFSPPNDNFHNSLHFNKSNTLLINSVKEIHILN